jgi:uncharacterized membrane protein YadS
MRAKDEQRQRTVRQLRSLAASSALAAIGAAVAAAFVHESGVRPVFAALAVFGAVLAITKARQANALRR